MTEDLILLPVPRSVKLTGGWLVITREIQISWDAGQPALEPLAIALQADLRELGGVECALAPDVGVHAGAGRIVLRLDDSGPFRADQFSLTSQHDAAELVGGDLAGLFYAMGTFRQMLRQFGHSLPCVRIEDAPDFSSRGVMLDISRDKVPTLDTLFHLVDLLAELRINHLELYAEHTFAYRNHADVWRAADPMTAEDIRALEAYCADRFIDLVPNQNSFGHFRRWLKHPRYHDLAETHGPFTYPWGTPGQGPFSLDPQNPGSLALLDELYSELLPNFSSRRFNVGCDETFDLGEGKSREACEQQGKGRVYLDFLLKIHELCRKHGRSMHCWGDIILKYPELVPELPDDVVLLDWGYEADHPFHEQCAVFAEAGRSFFVCPGTSSWLSLVGRTENALTNLRSAARHGLVHGACGYLITDWGDQGHWQHLPISYLGYAAGAAYAWGLEQNEDLDLASALDLHVFKDRGRVLGQLVIDLGNVYRRFETQLNNRSMLFQILIATEAELRGLEITHEEIAAAHGDCEELLARMGDAQPQGIDAKQVLAELSHSIALARHACRRAESVWGTRNQGVLRAELAELVEEQRRLWLLRNRAGGLDDSLAHFDAVRALYES